jgi:AcrR family transcriptional regulator
MSLPETASPLRERQRGLTRRLILEALAQAILQTGIHEFSMQEVAERAGVSLRTLYRYFPNREDLLRGLGGWIDEALRESGDLSTLDSVSARQAAAVVGDAMRAAGRQSDLAHAWVIANTATGFRSETTKEHDQIFRRLVESLGAHLDENEKGRLFAVTRYLASLQAWKVMTHELGLETEEAAEAATWALRTLLEEIEAGGRPLGRAPGH